MTAILLTVAGAAACYLLARERFAAAPAAIATLGVAAGIAACSGTRAGRTTRPQRSASWRARSWPMAGCGRRAAVRPADSGPGRPSVWRWGWRRRWSGREPLAFSGTLSLADVLWSSRGGLLATSPAVYVCGDRPVAAVPRRPRARGRRPGAAGAHDAVRVGARLLVVVGVAGAGGVPGPDALRRLRGGGRGRRGRRRAVARRPVLAAVVLLARARGLEPHVDEGGAGRQLRPRRAGSFGDLGAAQARALHGWIGHPPSMPANVAFAMANGVHPSAYDLLAPNRLAGRRGVRRRDRHRRAAMRRSWATAGTAAERDGGQSFRWATPLGGRHVHRSTTSPIWSSRSSPGPISRRTAPPQQLTLVVNGVPHGAGHAGVRAGTRPS